MNDYVQKQKRFCVKQARLHWHILNAISIIAVNYRVLHTPAAQKSEEAVDRLYNELINSEEPEGAVPISEFSEDAMRRAISGSMIHIFPTWSPDGSQIAFSTSRDGNLQIYKMNADGSDQTAVTFDAATNHRPA
jgi:hypothetical protein